MNDDDRQTNAAHVWWLSLGDVPDDIWCSWIAVLNEEERTRADRFVKPADRQQFIAAHGVLRTMLSHFMSGAPRDWMFETGSYGKPLLHPVHGRPEIHFNISHTGGAVACAVARGCGIGVDIESVELTANPIDLAKLIFAPAEIALLRAAPAAERAALFRCLWTLKEAYLKATGQGLSTALDAFAFSVSPIDISFPNSQSGDAGCWQFESTACASGHHLSTAINTPRPITLRHRRVAQDEIDALLKL